jgi:hypothetical protein
MRENVHSGRVRVLSSAKATETEVDGTKLTVTSFDISDGLAEVSVQIGSKTWLCEIKQKLCTEAKALSSNLGDLLSPDGQWAIFRV